MGINQWSRLYIGENSPIRLKYRIPTGEYLVKYYQEYGKIEFRDVKRNEIVLQKELNSLIELVLLMPDQEGSETIQRLKKRFQSKDVPRAGIGYENHHIIPHHICSESQLVITAEKYGVFNKDGSENIIRLPNWFHRESHNRTSKYCRTIREELFHEWNIVVEEGLDRDRDAIQMILTSFVDEVRNEVINLRDSGRSLNDFGA
ncbi:AHH domain-containing protein [Anabaena sp. CCY 0017]|uniref:AHH domain-containing protein n=1 Tax=Anabaena sp. CCY 0017 TaxID=3103866 RepID=UPI0039C6238A